MKKIKSALVSVFYKDELAPIVHELHRLGIKIYSTGGTQAFIENEGLPVTSVESLTSYPSILGGRVKTLHPKVFGGILARRENQSDAAQLETYQIPEIDLVIVDLYPFEETLTQTTDEEEIIEKIDIGGVSLIRAAAKNYNDVLIVAARNYYSELLGLLQDKQGFTTAEDRRLFAARAFDTCSHYDTQIFKYLAEGQGISGFRQSLSGGRTLRYGENPHQQAKFYGNLEEVFDVLGGKELSYNNLVDVDAAVNLIAEFTEPSFVVIKHTNACGVASRPTVLEAWKAALAGDSVSAFGGILATNTKIDKTTAEAINEIFFEVLIAPDFDEEAIKVFASKKNRILIRQKQALKPGKQFKNLLNGVIEQDPDWKTETATDLKAVTTTQPTEAQIQDLLFANKLVKHLKSNTIVLARNGQLIGMGCGQTSRVDALEQAIAKAKKFGFDVAGAAMASDAFFPFPDCVEIADKAGIKAVIQPGGSIKDQDSIDYCNQHGMAMVTTGTRHFKH
ncbi:bifunctional phosphoribosylaminoimidazolecarboxamide formyltransferase/IMP cyclohydrolase [soil metagenome]